MDVVVHPLNPRAGDTEEPEHCAAGDHGRLLAQAVREARGRVDQHHVRHRSQLGRPGRPVNHLSTAAVPGDKFTVITSAGDMTYKVESVTTNTKTSLKDSAIWAVVPNRLVLISCYTEDPWGKNVTVVASPVPGRCGRTPAPGVFE